MRIEQDYISNQYHQVYFIFTKDEVNQIFDEVAEHNNLKGRLTVKSRRVLTELVKDKLENDITVEELVKLDVVPISFRRYRYLTPVARERSLLLIVQFCILPTDLQLRFPSKIPNGIFTIPFENEMLKDCTKQVLLANNHYDYKDVDIADDESIVKYDLYYTKDDYIINEISDQINSFDDYDATDDDTFINSKVGETLILDEEDGVITKAKVKEIKKKVPKRLSNDIVKSLSFLGCKTVTDFRQKIREITRFSTSVALLLNYLSDYVIQSGDVNFDDIIISHFSEEDMEFEEIQRELIKEYIVWIINYNYADDNVLYMDKIIEEYEFDKLLFNNPTRVDYYQEFINRRIYEVKVLEYCMKQKIIEIDI